MNRSVAMTYRFETFLHCLFSGPLPALGNGFRVNTCLCRSCCRSIDFPVTHYKAHLFIYRCWCSSFELLVPTEFRIYANQETKHIGFVYGTSVARKMFVDHRCHKTFLFVTDVGSSLLERNPQKIRHLCFLKPFVYRHNTWSTSTANHILNDVGTGFSKNTIGSETSCRGHLIQGVGQPRVARPQAINRSICGKKRLSYIAPSAKNINVPSTSC